MNGVLGNDSHCEGYTGPVFTWANVSSNKYEHKTTCIYNLFFVFGSSVNIYLRVSEI